MTSQSVFFPRSPSFHALILCSGVPEPTVIGAEPRGREPEGEQRIQPPKAEADMK